MSDYKRIVEHFERNPGWEFSFIEVSLLAQIGSFRVARAVCRRLAREGVLETCGRSEFKLATQ